MAKLIFNLALLIFVFSLTLGICKRKNVYEPIANAFFITLLVVIVDVVLNLFIFADLPIFEKYVKEETKIQYNLNVETYCYQVDMNGTTKYCVLDEKGIAQYVDKGICETEVNNENVLQIQSKRVKNGVLDLFFWLPPGTSYVLKTNDIKLIY